MLLSSLLVIFLIFGLFLSMLGSRPKADAQPAVPELPQPSELSTHTDQSNTPELPVPSSV